MSSDIRDFSRRCQARLDALITSHTAQLIKSGAASHDRIAGHIAGLNLARTELSRETTNWVEGKEERD